MPFLVCPQCLSKEPLTAAVCCGCGADLRQLPPGPEAWTAAAPLAWEEDYLKHVPDARERCSLCEALDRILNKGAVVTGEVTISVAGIDLIYLGLQILLTSVETARQLGSSMVEVGPFSGAAP